MRKSKIQQMLNKKYFLASKIDIGNWLTLSGISIFGCLYKVSFKQYSFITKLYLNDISLKEKLYQVISSFVHEMSGEKVRLIKTETAHEFHIEDVVRKKF